jgi:acetyl/propionyl-CoA carboxylase alpha subunit
VALTLHGQPAGEVLVRHDAGERWFSWSLGQSRLWAVEHELQQRLHARGGTSLQLQLCAVLPGRVSAVLVAPDQEVEEDEPVLTLESMKLYHTLTAPLGARVQCVHVQAGDIVGHGQLLVEFAPLEASSADAGINDE